MDWNDGGIWNREDRTTDVCLCSSSSGDDDPTPGSSGAPESSAAMATDELVPRDASELPASSTGTVFPFEGIWRRPGSDYTHKMLWLSYYDSARSDLGSSKRLLENRGLVDDRHPFTVEEDAASVAIAYEKYSLKGVMVNAEKVDERRIVFENGATWCFSSGVPPPPTAWFVRAASSVQRQAKKRAVPEPVIAEPPQSSETIRIEEVSGDWQFADPRQGAKSCFRIRPLMGAELKTSDHTIIGMLGDTYNVRTQGRSLVVRKREGQFLATLRPDGFLEWTDGEVWRRLNASPTAGGDSAAVAAALPGVGRVSISPEPDDVPEVARPDESAPSSRRRFDDVDEEPFIGWWQDVSVTGHQGLWHLPPLPDDRFTFRWNASFCKVTTATGEVFRGELSDNGDYITFDDDTQWHRLTEREADVIIRENYVPSLLRRRRPKFPKTDKVKRKHRKK